MPDTKRLRVNWPDGLKLRTEPEPTDVSYTGFDVPFGTVVEAMGEPQRFDDRFSFQQVRTPEDNEGWVTYRDGDTIYLSPVEAEPPPARGKRLRVKWAQGLRMRSEPEPSLDSLTGVVVPNGTVVTAIGEPSFHPDGYVFQRARTPGGQVGWLTLRFGDTNYLVEVEAETEEEPEEPEPEVEETGTLWVVWFDGLKLREQPEPSLASFTGVIVPFSTEVTALGEPKAHEEGYTFQMVRLADGQVGWLTLSADDTIYLSEEEPEVEPLPVAQVSAAAGLWAEMRGSPGGPVQWWVGGAVPLRTVDPVVAGAKLGQEGQWIEVQTPAFKRGFINAQHLKPFSGSAQEAVVRPGESPYIYGIHDRYDRNVLKSVGVTGWVLFTYGINTDFQGVGGDRNTFYEWSSDGFGILARLNHGYGSSGTIPVPQAYDAFARTCAAFVERSIDPANPQGGCHIWIIGNEMNNPREYPGNDQGQGGSPITPEGYADCFNRVYRAIKRVYQSVPGLSPADGLVVPGAVDPYNAVAGCNGDWFVRMLRRIQALDGIALHAYTHGTSPGLITDRKRFGQEHNLPVRFPDKSLSWQYYNFYAYRTFMELIPAKWRDVPVFVTETDQVQTEWANDNSGWVKEMYAEINRWNREPDHQQIRCALLFRWAAFDGWQIKDKGSVLQDLKEAALRKYKWRA
jgi:hypothetical protein